MMTHLMLINAISSATIWTSTILFLVVILLLVVVLLVAKAKLVKSGNAALEINGETPRQVTMGGTLLGTLQNEGIFLSSACGGKGSCGQCRCKVIEGGGEPLPTELPHFSRKELLSHNRLACQVKVKDDIKVEIPEEVFGVKEWECEVISNRNVASFIKEFVVRLPEGEHMDFKAGSYSQIKIPKYEVKYADFDIDERFKSEWDKFKLWPLVATNDTATIRAYSMANYPAEGNIITLNVRVATPPFDRKTGGWAAGIKPGIASSYIFSLKPGDKVTMSGPYGDFHIQDTDAEMLYIGGGAGMAPLRAQILHLFRTEQTTRKVSYWYGARSRIEIFYEEDFRELERLFPNFSFHIALSAPAPEDNWTGYTGFIHQVIYDNYLKDHPAPEDIEYYMCGPGPMSAAAVKMLDDLGVEKDRIYFDDFGG